MISSIITLCIILRLLVPCSLRMDPDVLEVCPLSQTGIAHEENGEVQDAFENLFLYSFEMD